MSSDIFKNILANSFEDTRKDVQWLLDNNYITYRCIGQEGGFIYYRNKEFGWPSKYYGDAFILSSHYMSKRNVN